MTADQISKNLKLVGMDIGVHSILLVTGVVIPSILFIISLINTGEAKKNCGSAGCWNAHTYPVLYGLIALFCFGCLSIIWQIISLSLSSKYREAENEKTHLIPRTIETQLCVDIKPRNRNKELKK